MKIIQVNSATKKKKFTKEFRIFLIILISVLTVLIKAFTGADISIVYEGISKLIGSTTGITPPANGEVLVLFLELVILNNLLKINFANFGTEFSSK
jgi:hypothetical protein